VLANFFRVPEWEPDNGYRISFSHSSKEQPVFLVPFRGTYKDAAVLELHGGALFSNERLVRDEEVEALVKELCRGNAERRIVILAAPSERLGAIVHIVDVLRKTRTGRIVVMYDHRPNLPLEPKASTLIE
jgi:biopolymer transport protein ExbD